MVSASERGWNETDSRMPLLLCMALVILAEVEMEVFNCLQDSDREWSPKSIVVAKRRKKKRRLIQP